MKKQLNHIFVALLVVVISGCGNQSPKSSTNITSPSVSAGRGGIAFSVNWPATGIKNNRIIPDSAVSLVITVTQDGNTVGTSTITRPNSTGHIDNIPAGASIVKGVAKDNSDVIVASGSTNVTVVAGQNVAAALHFALTQLMNPKYALQFDGNQRVIIPNSPSLNPNHITIELMVKFGRLAEGDGYSPTDSQYIIGKGGDQTAGSYSVVQGGTLDGFFIHFYEICGHDFCNGGLYSLEINKWYHITSTYDGDVGKIYINGILYNENTVGLRAIGNSSPLYFGYNDVGGWPYYLTGQLAEVRIWNYARSESEIQSTMSHQLAGNENGLIGYWTFQESSNNQDVTDHSPFGNNGHLGSTPEIDIDDPKRITME